MNKKEFDFRISCVTVIDDYEPQTNHEIELKKGEIIKVYKKFDTGLWFGEKDNGKVGLFPISHVTETIKADQIKQEEKENEKNNKQDKKRNLSKTEPNTGFRINNWVKGEYVQEPTKEQEEKEEKNEKLKLNLEELSFKILDEKLAIALFDYDCFSNDEISFKRGDLIGILPIKRKLDWRVGIKDKKIGFFPSQYAKVIEISKFPKNNFESIAISLYDFHGLDQNELSLKKGDLIYIIDNENVGDGWLYGKIKNRYGVFPGNFISFLPSQAEARNLCKKLENFLPFHSNSYEDSSEEEEEEEDEEEEEEEDESDSNSEEVEVTELSKEEMETMKNLFNKTGNLDQNNNIMKDSDELKSENEEIISNENITDVSPSMEEETSTSYNKSIESESNEQINLNINEIDDLVPEEEEDDESSVEINTPKEISNYQQKKYIGICIALYDFSIDDENQNILSFSKGDYIFIHKKYKSSEWWKGEMNNKIGYFPSSYVFEKIEKKYIVKALCDYNPKFENDIEFQQNDIFLQIGDPIIQYGEFVVKGECNGKIGYFPCNYVEIISKTCKISEISEISNEIGEIQKLLTTPTKRDSKRNTSRDTKVYRSKQSKLELQRIRKLNRKIGFLESDLDNQKKLIHSNNKTLKKIQKDNCTTEQIRERILNEKDHCLSIGEKVAELEKSFEALSARIYEIQKISDEIELKEKFERQLQLCSPRLK